MKPTVKAWSSEMTALGKADSFKTLAGNSGAGVSGESVSPPPEWEAVSSLTRSMQ